MINAFVGRQPGDCNEAQRLLQWFGVEFRQGLEIDPIMDDRYIAHATPVQCSLGRFRTHPKRHVAIEPMSPALLPSAKGADGPGIKRAPDWAKDFMDVRNISRLAPPRSEPRDAVVLVNNQIKGRLRAIPLDCFENRHAASSAANDANSANTFLLAATLELIGKPVHLVATLL